MFGFPKINRDRDFKYKVNVLKSVTFQLKYPINKPLVNKLSAINSDSLSNFPYRRKIMRGELKVTVGEKTPIVQEQKGTTEGFEFSTKNQDCKVSITGDSLTANIPGFKYSNFYHSFPKIKETFFPILEDSGVNFFSRVAIRKVNSVGIKLENDSSRLSAMQIAFNPAIVENYQFIPGSEFLSYGLTRIVLCQQDFKLNISYGLLDQQINNKFNQILLDIDLFKTNAQIIVADVFEALENINSEIFNVFNWFMKDEFLKNLENTGGDDELSTH